ncbi:MAG TPA: Gfo/Idh/MocA family oxidoreductase [Clostridiales bacterium]|nr:Gfo/Idh/MocA family oxidoreductase [Clostridiales bacterium]
MKKIRLAVIGTGLAWERLHWPAIQELKDKYEIAALCNRTRSDAEKFADSIGLDKSNVYDDYNEMLKRDDIDAVDVLVPIQENFEAAAAVLRAGKHLIAEKPLAGTMEGANELLRLHKENPSLVMVAENYRYNDENNIIKDLVYKGRIGEVVYFVKNNVVDFKSEMGKDTFAATKWRQYPLFPGGAFLDAALHDIAAMRHILGPVDSVYANGRPQDEPYSPYMSYNCQILFKNKVVGQYNYFCDGQETQKPPIGLRIFGTRGEIYLEDKNSGRLFVSYRDGNSEEISYLPGRGYYNELLNFYNAFNGQENILVTPEVEVGDMKMIFDIITSIKTGQPVKVDP